MKEEDDVLFKFTPIGDIVKITKEDFLGFSVNEIKQEEDIEIFGPKTMKKRDVREDYINQLEQEIKDLKNKSNIEVLRNDINLKIGYIKQLKEKLSSAEKECDSLRLERKKLEDSNSEFRSLKTKYYWLKKKYNSLEEKYDEEQKQKSESTDVYYVNLRLNERIEELESQYDDLKKKYDNLVKNCNNFEVRRKIIKDETGRELSQRSLVLSRREQALNEKWNRCLYIEKENGDLKSEVKEYNKILDEYERKVRKLERQVKECRNPDLEAELDKYKTLWENQKKSTERYKIIIDRLENKFSGKGDSFSREKSFIKKFLATITDSEDLMKDIDAIYKSTAVSVDFKGEVAPYVSIINNNLLKYLRNIGDRAKEELILLEMKRCNDAIREIICNSYVLM